MNNNTVYLTGDCTSCTSLQGNARLSFEVDGGTITRVPLSFWTTVWNTLRTLDDVTIIIDACEGEYYIHRQKVHRGTDREMYFVIKPKTRTKKEVSYHTRRLSYEDITEVFEISIDRYKDTYPLAQVKFLNQTWLMPISDYEVCRYGSFWNEGGE